MFENITDYFIELLEQNGSVDIAVAEFKRNLSDDAELRTAYRAWCQEQGTAERYGFVDFCREYIEDRNDVWNSLKDYDE